MANTLTYDEGAQGWPSFYSYDPDWMLGMNNYFYTFNGGKLYRHNTNEVRNNFYGVQYNSTIQSVFNDMPLQNKLFKTINLEGDSRWGMSLATDIQDSGIIDSNWYEEKEQVFYAFIRNSGTVPAGQNEYALRSLNGISQSTIVTAGSTIEFGLDISLDTIMSIGDMLYFLTPLPTVPVTFTTTPQLAGQITAINIDLPNGINNIVIDTTIGGTVPIVVQDAFFLYIKNAIAESHGVLGHYCVFDISNNNTAKINLFAVESEVMKSYP
tara:strand:+ start:602 stop:1405 length:804 start_codon:yes stop_codon:yes gene_type:complete